MLATAHFATQTLHNYLDAAQRHPQLLPVIMDVVSILVKQVPLSTAHVRSTKRPKKANKAKDEHAGAS